MTSTQSNAAAIRAFRIVELLAQEQKPLTLIEISTRMELPKQSVHRLLKQLESTMCAPAAFGRWPSIC